MAALVGQLLFFAMAAALIGGGVWAVSVMRKPRPPLEEADDEDDEWRPRFSSATSRERDIH
ncbi:hypothetical protein [Mycolicibacterium houstonense]|uniref:hypothetical protein n=1 Tax=Mycolicibacterium houstonense TaxID=146021 RepID=UPI0008324228|nr:hypothetical protein [Mycolicibacterium houstonense]